MTYLILEIKMAHLLNLNRISIPTNRKSKTQKKFEKKQKQLIKDETMMSNLKPSIHFNERLERFWCSLYEAKIDIIKSLFAEYNDWLKQYRIKWRLWYYIIDENCTIVTWRPHNMKRKSTVEKRLSHRSFWRTRKEFLKLLFN